MGAGVVSEREEECDPLSLVREDGGVGGTQEWPRGVGQRMALSSRGTPECQSGRSPMIQSHALSSVPRWSRPLPVLRKRALSKGHQNCEAEISPAASPV